MKTSTKIIIGLVVLLIVAGGGWWIYFTNFTGRTASRYLGKEYRQRIELDNAVEVVSVAFQGSDDRSNTTKLITYKALDGYIYTEEYRDLSPLTGAARWLPYGNKEYAPSWYRSRRFTRVFGGVIDYELPQDCATVMSVSAIKDPDPNKTAYIKNLVYRSTSGTVLSKEYRDGFIDRAFEGWLEVKVRDENVK